MASLKSKLIAWASKQDWLMNSLVDLGLIEKWDDSPRVLMDNTPKGREEEAKRKLWEEQLGIEGFAGLGTFSKAMQNPDFVDEVQANKQKNEQLKGEQFINNVEEAVQEGKEWLGLAEPSIKDETDTNIETQLGSNVITDTGTTNANTGNNAQDTLKELWAREDEIRKETQAREDTAYQRAIEDMVKAGINPNLMTVNPAQSGGGITSATGLESAGYGTDVSAMINLLEKEIDIAFEGKQNEKDRFTQILSSVLAAIIFKSGSKK